MHLAALVESIEHVCCRYRLRAFQPLLASAGCELALRELPHNWWSRVAIGRGLRHADGAILQRKLLAPLELALLRRRVSRLLFDFDDGVWMRDSYAAKGFYSRKRLSRFRDVVRNCDGVVAGNRFLADQARAHGAHRVQVIPTCVDPEQYPIRRHSADKNAAELVWIGSSSTLRGLESIHATLEAIGAAHPGARLKLICDRFLDLKNLPIVRCPWSEATEIGAIAAADVGVAWMPDDPWSQGKCGLKVLQYMAAGLPVIANPAGVHSEMIVHGVNGFLVNSTREWVEAVGLLLKDPDLRRRMGDEGRRIVEDRYSIRVGADLWLGFLDAATAQRESA